MNIDLTPEELEQVLIAAKERRYALDAASLYYDLPADRAEAREWWTAINEAVMKLEAVAPIRTGQEPSIIR